MKYLLLGFLFFLLGCGEVDTNELKKLNHIKTEHQVQVNEKTIVPVEEKKIVKADKFEALKIKNSHEKQMKEMEYNFKKEQLHSEEKIQTQKINNSIKLSVIDKEKKKLMQESRYKFYELIAIVVTLLTLFLSMLIYFFKKKKLELESYNKVLEVALSSDVDEITKDKILHIYEQSNKSIKLLGSK